MTQMPPTPPMPPESGMRPKSGMPPESEISRESRMPRMLESGEAARRLGVKLPTLYAYVSRGLLASHRAPEGRRSLFAAEDVEALAKRARGGAATDTRLATVTTSITQLRDDGPVYRGSPATVLATTVPYEEAAELLWRG